MTAINLNEKLTKFSDCWTPKIIATYNDNEVMLAKFDGEFVWHSHPDTDDFFFVIEGDVTIEMPDKTVTLGPGEMYVVPKGVEHKPSTKNGASVLLIEPKGTPNSGDEKTAAVKVEI